MILETFMSYIKRIIERLGAVHKLRLQEEGGQGVKKIDFFKTFIP